MGCVNWCGVSRVHHACLLLLAIYMQNLMELEAGSIKITISCQREISVRHVFRQVDKVVPTITSDSFKGPLIKVGTALRPF